MATISPSTHIGTELPKDLRGISLPATIVAHVDCLGCTVSIPAKIEDAFKLSGVTHVVFAPDPEPYDRLAHKYHEPRPKKGSLADAEAIGAGFGPRVYRFDAKGRLVYAQMDPSQPLEEAVHEANHY